MNDEQVPYAVESDFIRYRKELAPGEQLHARIIYAPTPRPKRKTELKHQVGVSIRRFLSDARDNQISRSKWLLNIAEKAKRLAAKNAAANKKSSPD